MNLLVGLLAQDHHDPAVIGPLVADNVALHSPQVFHVRLAESEITFICLTSQDDFLVLEACDAALVIVDGLTGLSPVQMNLWSKACDSSIPRGVLSVNSVGTRADFDEVVAIAERVLDDDILVRHMPIVSDDESTLVGQFDILTGQILARDANGFMSRPGDPEHMQLTFERREDLVETLTHFSEGEALIEALIAGMPTNTPGLERAFLADDIVAVTAIDNGVGVPVLREWLAARKPRWIPSVDSQGVISDASNSPTRVGLGISAGLARTWGPHTHELQCTCSFEFDTPCLVACGSAAPGHTFTESGQMSKLFAPEF